MNYLSTIVRITLEDQIALLKFIIIRDKFIFTCCTSIGKSDKSKKHGPIRETLGWL